MDWGQKDTTGYETIQQGGHTTRVEVTYCGEIVEDDREDVYCVSKLYQKCGGGRRLLKKRLGNE